MMSMLRKDIDSARGLHRVAVISGVGVRQYYLCKDINL